MSTAGVDAYSAIAELLHKSQIVDLLTKKFLYIDERRFDLLQTEIFAAGPIITDNGDGPRPSTTNELVAGWERTLGPLDGVFHQGENMAHAIAYGSATHYKASATQGKTRTFVGVYEFDLLYSLPQGWRVNGLKFTLKYMDGNLTLT